MADGGDPDSRHWHLDKRLNVGHMLTTLSLFGGLVVAMNGLQDQVIENTNENRHQRELIERVERQADRRDMQTREQLEKIDKKLDKILDRELRRNGNGH